MTVAITWNDQPPKNLQSSQFLSRNWFLSELGRKYAILHGTRNWLPCFQEPTNCSYCKLFGSIHYTITIFIVILFFHLPYFHPSDLFPFVLTSTLMKALLNSLTAVTFPPITISILVSLMIIYRETKLLNWYCNYVIFNPLNAELNPICHLLVLLGDLTFMGPCIVSIFQFIFIKMQRYTFYLYLETALSVSGCTSTHHQERIQLYQQHLIFVAPLLLPPAIVEKLEPVWVYCGWRAPPTAYSHRFHLFQDSGRSQWRCDKNQML